jgi:hypothetical protein
MIITAPVAHDQPPPGSPKLLRAVSDVARALQSRDDGCSDARSPPSDPKGNESKFPLLPFFCWFLALLLVRRILHVTFTLPHHILQRLPSVNPPAVTRTPSSTLNPNLAVQILSHHVI